LNEGIEPGTRTAYAYCVRVLRTRTAYAYWVRVLRTRTAYAYAYAYWKSVRQEKEEKEEKEKKKNKWHVC
jgi:hypothetical protein